MGEVQDHAVPTLLACISQRLWDDEQLGELIGAMYAGPGAPAPNPYLARKRDRGEPLRHPLKSVVDIDMKQLEGVVSFDTFMIDNTVRPVFVGPKYEPVNCGYALYGLASFFNHSCMPSAYRAFFGDFITIRASHAIKKGEEVTIQYTSDDRDLMLRKFGFSKMRFLCDCLLCRADAADGDLLCGIRKEVADDMLEKGIMNLQYADEQLAEVENAHLDTPERRACGVKPDLWNPNQYRAEVAKYYMMHDTGSYRFQLIAIECLMSCLETQGIRILDKSTSGRVESRFHGRLPVDPSTGPISYVHSCALLSLEIATIFHSMEDTTRAENWVRAAAWGE